MPMLDPTRWLALSPHLDAAFEVTGLERERWLAALEERDPKLAADLRLLLAEHEVARQGRLPRRVAAAPDRIRGSRGR